MSTPRKPGLLDLNRRELLAYSASAAIAGAWGKTAFAAAGDLSQITQEE
jgi:hypothetical protein